MNDISFEKEYLMISNYEKQVDIGKAHFLKYDQEALSAKIPPGS